MKHLAGFWPIILLCLCFISLRESNPTLVRVDTHHGVNRKELKVFRIDQLAPRCVKIQMGDSAAAIKFIVHTCDFPGIAGIL
jgi:hypothetical protein